MTRVAAALITGLLTLSRCAVLSAKTYLLLGCTSRACLDDFVSEFVIRRPSSFSIETDEATGVFVASVQADSIFSDSAIKIISLPALLNKEASVRTLLRYTNYGHLDGLLCALEDVDERFNIHHIFHFTNARKRVANTRYIRFKKQGATRYMYLENNFTFWGGIPILKHEKMTMAKSIFASAQPVRIMDTFWLYLRAYQETFSSCANDGSMYLHHGYDRCLFNGIIASDFPWKLLMEAIEEKDLRLVDYITAEIPHEHLAVMKEHVEGFNDVLLSIAAEVEPQYRNMRFHYQESQSCLMFYDYFESFDNFTRLRIRQIKIHPEYLNIREKAEAELKVLYEEEMRLQELKGTTNPAILREAIWMLNAMSKTITTKEIEFQSLAKSYHDELVALKELEDEYFLV